MDMEMEANDGMLAMMERLDARLGAAAGVLEQAAERLAGFDVEASHTREHELEAELAETQSRFAEIQTRLAAAEATLATVKASGRKTIAAGATLVGKDGVALEAGSLDAALASLSVEQRIAVKAGLLRQGLLS